MRKFIALALLGLFLLRHFFLRIIKRLLPGNRGGENGREKQFLENYREDGIRALEAAEARMLRDMQGCIRCGLCDTLCKNAARLESAAFEGPSLLVSTHSRNLPETRHVRRYLLELEPCGDCFDCMNVCPTGVPIRELVTFMERFARNDLEILGGKREPSASNPEMR